MSSQHPLAPKPPPPACPGQQLGDSGDMGKDGSVLRQEEGLLQAAVFGRMNPSWAAALPLSLQSSCCTGHGSIGLCGTMSATSCEAPHAWSSVPYQTN